ncbi:hypothetical protein GcC1_220034, partial [Golovinomyces cichoracearum]
ASSSSSQVLDSAPLPFHHEENGKALASQVDPSTFTRDLMELNTHTNDWNLREVHNIPSKLRIYKLSSAVENACADRAPLFEDINMIC